MTLEYDGDEAVAHLAQSDLQMGALIANAGAFSLRPRSDATVFEALLRSIVYQQLSDRAASTIYRRVLALLEPATRPTPELVLGYDAAALRAAGMSFAKIRAAHDLAEKTISRQIPSREDLDAMTDEEVVEALTIVRGIGPWTVQMLLIFYLGRPDVLPVTDLGVRKGFMFTYGCGELPTPDELIAQGEKWRPFRSVASWYLWRAVTLNTGVAPPTI